MFLALQDRPDHPPRKRSQLPGALVTLTRRIEMADVKAPQQLDPQDLVKLLVALRRALKDRAA